MNDSTKIRGDNKIIAILIAKSINLKTLDLTASKLTLLSAIATVLPWGHLLTSLNLSVVGNNNHHNFLLRYETIKRIIDKLRCLENFILAGTNLCRKSITYICTYLATTIKKVNLATERVRDSDVRALTFQCPNINFLNLTETLVTFDVFYELAATWNGSMRYLSLPKRVTTELNLSCERVRNYEYLWRQNVVNPRDTPVLAILAQFKTTVDSMSALKYLNIGNYTGSVLDTDQNSKHTLQRLFPTHYHKPEAIRRSIPSRGGSMLSVPRRMDNEHGYRIRPISKSDLHGNHNPNGGHRHIKTLLTTNPEEEKDTTNHKRFPIPLIQQTQTNLIPPLSGGHGKDHNTTIKIGIHHPMTGITIQN